MIIVCGHLLVDADDRGDYLDGCRDVVARGRAAEGCLDFALSPDLLEPGRINIVERWESRAALDAFRGSGTPDDQQSRIRSASVAEYDVAGETVL